MVFTGMEGKPACERLGTVAVMLRRHQLCFSSVLQSNVQSSQPPCGSAPLDLGYAGLRNS